MRMRPLHKQKIDIQNPSEHIKLNLEGPSEHIDLKLTPEEIKYYKDFTAKYAPSGGYSSDVSTRAYNAFREEYLNV